MLGIDWALDMAAEFGGQLASASITARRVTGYDPSDPAGAPLSTPATFTCDAVAFAYGIKFLDGETVKRGDFRVILLRGTMKDEAEAASSFVPSDNDEISVPPPGSTTPSTARIVSVDAITEAFVTCQVRGVPFTG